MEAITWSQLGFHTKPLALLHVANYITGLIEVMGT